MFKTRFISMLALLMTAATGAWATEVTIATNQQQTSYTSGDITISVSMVGDGDGAQVSSWCPMNITCGDGNVLQSVVVTIGYYPDNASNVTASAGSCEVSGDGNKHSTYVTVTGINASSVSIGCNGDVQIEQVVVNYSPSEPEPAGDETVVTITNADLPTETTTSMSKDGVTITAYDAITNTMIRSQFGPGSFTNTIGNFTKIEVVVVAGDGTMNEMYGLGWTGDASKRTWTGNAESVEFAGIIQGADITITCTIEPAAAPEPEPAAAWTGGTYTATATENLGAITVNDDATLTINEGVTVTVTGGINVASGTLTVTGPGTLVVTGGNGGNGGDAGPGGTGGVAISGNIIVQGGASVTATGGNGGTGGNAGPGGTGGVAISGNIIVQGGATVTATGGNGGTGGNDVFYGGNGGDGGNAFAGTLTYKSGTVTANGGSGGSGGSGGWEGGSSGFAGLAFDYDVDLDFTQTTGYSVTDGTSTIDSVEDQINVVISGGTPTGYNVTANLVDDAYWSTFYSNEGNYQAPEGTQVFAVTLNTTTAEITMIPVSDRIVKSGQGVVMKQATESSEPTTTITMTLTGMAATDSYFSGNSLTGTMNSITNPGNAFVLNNPDGGNGVGFYRLTADGTIGANKAYLTYSGALAREFFLFDEATGIESIDHSPLTIDHSVYDLQGRRVAQPTKGLYIVNGKKVIK